MTSSGIHGTTPLYNTQKISSNAVQVILADEEGPKENRNHSPVPHVLKKAKISFLSTPTKKHDKHNISISGEKEDEIFSEVSDYKQRPSGAKINHLPPDAFLKKSGSYKDLFSEPYDVMTDDTKL
jgi:hypothetical protein